MFKLFLCKIICLFYLLNYKEFFRAEGGLPAGKQGVARPASAMPRYAVRGGGAGRGAHTGLLPSRNTAGCVLYKILPCRREDLNLHGVAPTAP